MVRQPDGIVFLVSARMSMDRHLQRPVIGELTNRGLGTEELPS
jgi:hypothetical protein